MNIGLGRISANKWASELFDSSLKLPVVCIQIILPGKIVLAGAFPVYEVPAFEVPAFEVPAFAGRRELQK